MSPASLPHADTGTDMLLAGLEEGVLTLTLNRPEARNALSIDLGVALGAALDRADRDAAVRCVVLTGANDCFCAGGDVKDMVGDGLGGGLPIEAMIGFQRRNQRDTAVRLYHMPKPTLAVIPGAAAGAGLALALACDLRLMSSSAFLTTAFTNIAFCGDYGATFFMNQIVGSAKTRELFFFANRIDAAEALRLGLVNWTCTAGELRSRGTELARQLAARPTLALGYAKENINRAASSGDVVDCLDIEAAINLHLTKTEDHRRAVEAFIAKETPVFHGR